ncbi:MAG: hypothetical protein HXY41_12370 [Chloroflexi bacterium]|nr:hypothetical protein [Chloroflexota bacterium]
MSEQTEQILAEAFNLIEADRLSEAQTLLTPLLTTQPDNPDVWWLYAHAVTDRDTARQALKRAASLNPDDPDITDLLAKLEQQAPSAVSISEKEPAFLTDIPATLPDLPESEDDFIDIDDIDLEMDLPEDEDQEEETPSRLLPLVILGIIAVVAVVAVAILTSQPPSPATVTPTPNILAANPTETQASISPDLTALAELTPNTFGVPTEAETAEPPVPTETPTATIEETLEAQPEETLTAPTAIQTQPTEQTDYTAALSAFQLASDPVNMEQTDLGSTLLVSVCVTAGPDLRATLPTVMDILARQPLPADADALGARMVNCEDNTLLLLIVVAAADAQNYANGSVSEEDFQALWKSL